MANGTLNFANLAFDLLWTNNAPNTGMGAQYFFSDNTLIAGYDGYLLFFNTPVSSEIRLMSQFLPCNYQAPDYAQLTGMSIGGNALKTRYIGYTDASMHTASYGYSGSTEDNTSCIPYALYGYRYVTDV